jgi:AcrR family transcriptional regulator
MNNRSGKESKKRIIDAAMAVFSAKGYAKASIREIAKAAGISIGGVYLYFKNKEDLYRNLIKERKSGLRQAIETTLGKSKTASDALSLFIKLYLDYAVKHKEFIILHIREHGFTFGAHEKRQFFKQQRKLIEQIIQRGIRSGEFRKCDPQDMATILMGLLRGIVLTMALDDMHIKPKMLNEFIFEGLLTVSDITK